MRHTLKHKEDGQTLVLVVVCMIMLFGICALAVDTVGWYTGKERAQTAADLAALAAAPSLDESDAKAIAKAQQYVDKNLPGATAAITTNYQGVDKRIQVRVKYGAPTFFAKALGLDDVEVGAQAAAETDNSRGKTNWAIFAKSTQCGLLGPSLLPGFDWDGILLDVDGAIHSNGSFRTLVSLGARGTYASAGGPNNCSPLILLPLLTDWGSGPVPEKDTANMDYPVTVNQSQLSCTYTAPKLLGIDLGFTILTNAQLRDGTYCTDGTFIIADTVINKNAKITVRAKNVIIAGLNIHLTPYEDDVLIYSTGVGLLDGLNTFAGVNMELGGLIYAPDGRVLFTSLLNAQHELEGFIEAQHVQFIGVSVKMKGTGPEISKGGGALLVE